jgi:uncharacterized protein (UPF0335 family)
MHRPLPYSAFPEELAHHLGAMTVAFQRIEEEVLGLLRSLVPIDSEILDALLSKNWQISARLHIAKEVAELSLRDDIELSRVRRLVERIEEISHWRNDVMHAASHGFNKNTGEVIQLVRKKRKAVGKILSKSDLELGVDRMYLVLESFDQLNADVEDWDEPLKFWAKPGSFLSRAQ